MDTGDDNVVIKEGTRDVLVAACLLLNGHGASIGSLGENFTRGVISNIRMRDLFFQNTRAGARIKTWQGGQGAVRNISFVRLEMERVASPIVINQYYCPKSQHPEPCKLSQDAVSISNIRYAHIRGTTSRSAPAVSIRCSDNLPCRCVPPAPQFVVQQSRRRLQTLHRPAPGMICRFYPRVAPWHGLVWPCRAP